MASMPSRISGPCPSPGCPNKAGQCVKHARQRESARGTRQQRGYDAEYDALGREYQGRMDAGERFNCWVCNKPLGTRRGVDWQLGHDKRDRSIVRGPECPACNHPSGRGRRMSPRA